MKGRGSLWALVAALVLLVGGLALLFQLRLGQGDIFPAYSSFRVDPLGTRALHDGLEQVPGLRVERWLKPIKDIPVTPPRTILFAGVSVWGWHTTTTDEFNALDAAVRAGSRVVITIRAKSASDETTQEAFEEKADRKKEKAGKGKAEKKKEPPGKAAKKEPEKKENRPPAREREERESRESSGDNKRTVVDLKQLWGVDLKERMLFERGDDLGATRVMAGDLPATVPWKSDVYFKAEQGVEWRTIYQRGGEAVLVERQLGRGSIVLAADSYFVSNEALQANRATSLLTWMIGPHSRVLFDENHLGVELQPGVAALARRYGLAEAFFTLLLLAALFVWQRMALFVPPPEEVREVTLSYQPAAGLEALLRRSVPPTELAAVCVEEWKRTARPGDVAKAAAVTASAPKNTSAAALHNRILQALRRR